MHNGEVFSPAYCILVTIRRISVNYIGFPHQNYVTILIFVRIGSV